jgi:murein L,D-transpeptidase YcbB/YkuD
MASNLIVKINANNFNTISKSPGLKKILYFFIALGLVLQGCNWFKETPEVGLLLKKHFNNKLYDKFDTAAYNQVFIHYLDTLKPQMVNPSRIKAFYEKNNLNPEFVTRFFIKGELDSLAQYISRVNEHGYNPKLFVRNDFKPLLAQLKANKFKKIEEVYPVIAELEIRTAESLIKYNNLVYYGSVNPRKIFRRYYIPVKRPDSVSVEKVLETPDLLKLLQDIQPKSTQYKEMQHALNLYEHTNVPDQKAIRLIKLNMERLRWKMPSVGIQHVEVNIPDFSLTWFKGADTLINMKVCVGGSKEDDYDTKIKAYLKSGKLDDKPKNHETPLLFSKLNSIQVNPVWNIPMSIAKSEIYFQAARNSNYLNSHNIKVYRRGNLVEDPDTIKWSNYAREKLPFQFKQGSGEDNALGKFKFIFENGSSIYLHDTNNKSAFKLAKRDISHGCVRVERPLDFAKLLVKDDYQYDKLRMDVNLPPVDTTRMAKYLEKQAKKSDTLNVFQLKPSWFGVKKQVPIIINYITAWSQNGQVQFRSDVYGLDEILWRNLQKYL